MNLLEWFNRALDLAPEERAAFLAEAERQSAEFGAELRSLVEAHASAEGEAFLEVPAAEPWLLSTVEQRARERPRLFAVGERWGDFTIVRHLGSGAFSHVYHALDERLGRGVAIKASLDHGDEARRMAPLIHDGIVTIYSEVKLAEQNLKFICMQLIAGTTLQELIRALPRNWDGRELLKRLDGLARGEATFNPTLHEERASLAPLDRVEATLTLGIRLASALAFAHERRVLHSDIKPANILLTTYGRPMLTDFNTAILMSDEEEAGDASRGPSGGTPGYMSPEQHKLVTEPWNRVRITAASDLYSLATVLVELLRGVKPQDHAHARALLGEEAAVVRDALLLGLHDRASDRTQSATRWSTELTNALEIYRAQKRVARFRVRGPTAVLFIAAMVGPQVIGSVINISYNSLRVMTQLDAEQIAAFRTLVVIYNGLSYSILPVLVVRYAMPLFRALKGSASAQPLAPLRRVALRLPWVLALASSVGWLPGAWFFPGGIGLLAHPVGASVYFHFFVSITLSWLVALNYAFLFVLWMSLNRAYPYLWDVREDFRTQAPLELARAQRGVAVFVGGCGLVPLVGAMLSIGFGTETAESHAISFRVLLIVLIGLGAVGFGMAMVMYRSIRDQIAAVHP